MKRKSFYLFLLGSIFLISCGPKTIFEQRNIIPSQWTYQDQIAFEYNISDTTKAYNLVLVVKHAADFSFENLYVNVTTVFPDGKKITNPVSLQLANKLGDWLGKCSGDNCTVNIEMVSRSFYKLAGKYSLIFSQLSREDSIKGINSFTVKIEESE